MGRDWRRLALAALAAAAVVLTGIHGVHAQASKAQQVKKGPEKSPADEEEEELKKPAATAKKKVDPAEAQRAVEAAGKLVETGKYDQAIQSLSATLSGGGMPPATLAKALFYRGLAYRQQQQPALAIADFTSALWIKGGLSQTDRTSATQQRTAAYQEAGLNEKTGEVIAVAAPTHSPVVRTKPPGEGDWGTSTTTSTTTTTTAPTEAPKQVAQPSGGNWFNDLFGGSGSSQQQQQQKQQQQPASFQTTTTKVQAEPQASSWSTNTEVKAAPKEIETASIKPSKPEGRFRVVVATVRTQDEANAIAVKLKRDYAAVAQGEPDIDQTVFGNMGTFYRVRVGPFASQGEGQAACAKLKGSGLDCLIVMQ